MSPWAEGVSNQKNENEEDSGVERMKKARKGRNCGKVQRMREETVLNASERELGRKGKELLEVSELKEGKAWNSRPEARMGGEESLAARREMEQEKVFRGVERRWAWR